ncbi:DUF1385 domain-containing protein [Niallia circulans]|jgi:uncharacterized protein YqhQ|uniref:DUF1385 domain-containing protein n=1 Tax=Niallia circulans TaxID=1397 RepID=UPI0026EA0E6C|nr:DUF1385 domain-containing protein [Niallia circulans]
MSIIKGGSAGFNNVVFYSENFSSKAIRNKDGTIIIDISKRKIAPKFERLIKEIPLIRGLYLFVKPLIVMWKIYLMVLLPLLVFLLLVSRKSGKSNDSSLSFLPIIAEWIQNYFLLLVAIILVIFGVIIKLSNLGKYHGAEHMTDTSYNTFTSLEISDVVKQSRIHSECGTNFVVFLFIMYLILSFFISDFIVLIMLSVCLGYELFLIQSKILAPLYWIGGFFQYTLFTSKPSINHLEVAIASYKALIRAEEN